MLYKYFIVAQKELFMGKDRDIDQVYPHHFTLFPNDNPDIGFAFSVRMGGFELSCKAPKSVNESLKIRKDIESLLGIRKFDQILKTNDGGRNDIAMLKNNTYLYLIENSVFDNFLDRNNKVINIQISYTKLNEFPNGSPEDSPSPTLAEYKEQLLKKAYWSQMKQHLKMILQYFFGEVTIKEFSFKPPEKRSSFFKSFMREYILGTSNPISVSGEEIKEGIPDNKKITFMKKLRGETRSRETSRPKKSCHPGRVLDEKTGRCVREESKSPKKNSCPPGKVLKCVKEESKSPKKKTCPPGKVLNEKTGRCVKHKVV